METFVVIGLGRFGSAVAEELCALGHQVLAIDTDEAAVQKMADRVTQAGVGDCRDMDVLRALGVNNARCAVVAFSDDIGNSVLITLNLKELGIPRIVCKARSASHEELLRRIGADHVIFPELESGRNLAHALNNRDILEFIQLSEHYSIVKTGVPESWLGKTSAELEIRKQFKVTIVAVQGSDGNLQTAPLAGYTFHRGDLLFSLGRNEDTDRLLALE